MGGGGGGGAGHSTRGKGGGGGLKTFLLFLPQFGLKIRWGEGDLGPQAPPLDPPLQN